MDIDQQQHRRTVMSRHAASTIVVITAALMIAGAGVSVSSAAPGGGNGGGNGGGHGTTTTTPSSTSTTSTTTTSTSTTTTTTATLPPATDPASRCVDYDGCHLESHGGTVVWSSAGDWAGWSGLEPQFPFRIALYRSGVQVAYSEDHAGHFDDTRPGDDVYAWTGYCNPFDLRCRGIAPWYGYVLVANP